MRDVTALTALSFGLRKNLAGGRVSTAMSDVFTTAERSKVMASVRSRGNRSTELVLVTAFKEHKITGWRRHYRLS